jgi:hypothetical protein
MKLPTSLVVAGLFALTAPARAEVPDCATFPGGAKFACYDNVSRAPKPDPEVKPAGVKTKPVAGNRKTNRDQ